MQRFLIAACVWFLLGSGDLPCSLEEMHPVQAADVDSERSPSHPEHDQAGAPILIISSAGVERLLDDVDYFFETAGRPEYAALVRGFLAVVGDLKGIDRGRPFGVMMVIDPGEAPDPVFVGFVPVAAIEELEGTLQAGSIKLQKKIGEKNRYELVTPDEKFQVLSQNNYLFISRKSETLKHRFQDPVALTKPLTDRYDLAVSFLFRNAPQDMKNMILDYLRAQIEADFVKRRNESEIQFQNRTTKNRLFLAGMENLFLQGDSLTLGWKLSKKEKSASLELSFEPMSQSRLAGTLQRLGNSSSRFSKWHGGNPALVASSTLPLGKIEQNSFMESLQSILHHNVAQLFAESVHQKQVETFFRSLQPTISTGLLDYALRFDGTEPGRFVLRGGIKVVQEEAVKNAFSAVLRQLRKNGSDFQWEPNAVSHRGISFHRVVRKSAGRSERRLFGDDVALYFGVGSGVLWLSVGAADETFPALKEMIEQNSSESADDSKRSKATILHLSSAMSPWIPFLPEESGSFAKLAGEAFSKGEDTVSIDCHTTASGIRFRIRFDAGFIRLVGLSLVQRIEGSR